MINKNEIITIAGGHGGSVGASATHKGIAYKEEVLAEKLAIRLSTMLVENGYKAYNVTPNGRFSSSSEQLKTEVAQANKYNAKLHLCIHFNASDGAGYGTEQYITARGGEAEKFANLINNSIVALGFRNRGVKVSGFYVPKYTKAPCVLTEICFIDNSQDMEKYDQEKTAIALFKAITNVEYKAPQNSKEVFYRVVADGVIIASYSVLENASAEVLKQMKLNKSKIEVLRVVK